MSVAQDIQFVSSPADPVQSLSSTIVSRWMHPMNEIKGPKKIFFRTTKNTFWS